MPRDASEWRQCEGMVATMRKDKRMVHYIFSAHTPAWAPNAPGVTNQSIQKDGTVVEYHGRELPQVSFLSRQKFCLDKHMFVATKVLSRQTRVCRDKSKLVATKRFL